MNSTPPSRSGKVSSWTFVSRISRFSGSKKPPVWRAWICSMVGFIACSFPGFGRGRFPLCPVNTYCTTQSVGGKATSVRLLRLLGVAGLHVRRLWVVVGGEVVEGGSGGLTAGELQGGVEKAASEGDAHGGSFLGFGRGCFPLPG